MITELAKQLAQLQQAHEQGLLDEVTYRATVTALEAQQTTAGTPPTVAAGERGAAISGAISNSKITTGSDNIEAGGHVIRAEAGSTVLVGSIDDLPVTMTAVDRETALGHYLHHVISRNRSLQLQGIRSGGKLVHIELDQIYIRLRATQQRLVEAEERWLAEEAGLAPGEGWRHHGGHSGPRFTTETVTVKVEEAMAEHPRLVVLGDPGSGKTTLLRYLALLYARDLAEGRTLVQTRLVATEPARLPIVLPLRQLGSYLRDVGNPSVEGHKLLLDFFRQALANERLDLPANFFDAWLTNGTAVILLDGLDEVADGDLRRRIARLVESFTAAYPDCRYVVTSRIVGYSGTARLGEAYTTTTVRDFTLADVRQFLLNWHRLVAAGLMGVGPSAEAYALDQTEQLLSAIEGNERIRDLAINPLLLTVIALVHRDRVTLPDRRAELYGEAVDVLLGKWDEARGVAETPIVAGLPFDSGDRRLMLQQVALAMHERQWKEIEVAELRLLLHAMFAEIVTDARASEAAVDRFLRVIEERSGLLVARGEGVYAFSHLTFQEYLAALAITAQDDYIAATLRHSADGWWREVILLAAGHLSMTSRTRTTQLIQAIAEQREEPEPYHNLVLAAECLRDVGSGRVQGDLESRIQTSLRNELQTLTLGRKFGRTQVILGPRLSSVILQIAKSALVSAIRNKNVRLKAKAQTTFTFLVERRIAAATALGRINGDHFWKPPYGEPMWLHVPRGEFWMGNGEQEHRLYLDEYWISPVVTTNIQYEYFIRATSYLPPKHWVDGRLPRGQENYPVVNITWKDTLSYCAWLSDVTDKQVSLPSEAQWEKAARGNIDRRTYPWGNDISPSRCNYQELNLWIVTPVGIFPEGISPYGCYDMVGNVYEWTRSVWGKSYENPDFILPYDPTDGRENLEILDDRLRVIKGGSFKNNHEHVKCSLRERPQPGHKNDALGFRVICSSV